jgi:hypothetical protein
MVAVLVSAGFYIMYLESKITKLRGEILNLKLEIDIMRKRLDLSQPK